MTLDEYENIIKKMAKEYGVELTENAYKIARFRERTQLPMSKCPCSQNDPDRFCISEKCMADIMSTGKCHCQCFKKKGD